MTNIHEKPYNFTYNIKNVKENKGIFFIKLAKNKKSKFANTDSLQGSGKQTL